MRVWLVGLLASILVGTAASEALGSAEFSFEGSSAYEGRFEAVCEAVGIGFPVGGTAITLSTTGGSLTVRRTVVNRTILLTPPNEVEPQLPGRATITEKTTSMNAGNVTIVTPRDGLVVAFPYGYTRTPPTPFRVDWTASSTSMTAPRPDTPTLAGNIWTLHEEGASQHRTSFPGWTREATVNGTVTARGDLSLYLRVAQIQSNQRHDLGPYAVEQENRTTPLASHTRILLTDAFLDLKGVELGLPSGAQAACHGVDGDLEGRLIAQDATGQAPGANGTTTFDHKVVELEGRFQIHEAPVDLPLVSGNRGRTHARAEGDVRLAALDFYQAAPIAESAAVVAASAGAVLLAALVAGARYAGSIVGVFYSRFGRDQALDNQKRDLVHEAVRANPALDLSDLAGLTGLHRTTVFYHVQVLERVGLVSTLRHGRSVRVLGRELRNNHDLPRLLAAKDHRYGFLAQALREGPRPLREVAPLLAKQFGLSRRGAYHAINGALRFGVLRRMATDPEVMLACANT